VSKNVPRRKETGLPADRNVLRAARPITTEDHPPPAPITLMDVADMEAEEEAAKVEVSW
jgi:hypothetical protein